MFLPVSSIPNNICLVVRCGHCKSMAPAWAKLAEEWAGKPDTLVAEVNCDVENELCESMGVDGFPSIKYGDPNALEDYEGGRDYESLAAFAQENLKGVCAPNKTENCSEEKKLQLDAFMAMPSSDLLELIQDQENRIKAAEEKFEADLDTLQNKFQEISKEKDEAIAKAKASGLSLMKSVSVFKAKTNDIAGDEL